MWCRSLANAAPFNAAIRQQADLHGGSKFWLLTQEVQGSGTADRLLSQIPASTSLHRWLPIPVSAGDAVSLIPIVSNEEQPIEGLGTKLERVLVSALNADLYRLSLENTLKISVSLPKALPE